MLQYADSDALRAHWPSVRKFAVELSQLASGRAQRRQHWLGVETTILFEDHTYLPFDDLDAIDKYGFEVAGGAADGGGREVESLGRCCYPLPLQFKKGQPDRPTAQQVCRFSLRSPQCSTVCVFALAFLVSRCYSTKQRPPPLLIGTSVPCRVTILACI